MTDTTIWSFCRECVQFIIISYLYRDINYIYIGGAVANRLRRRTSDQTVLGSNPAVAAALSPWTRLFTPIVPRRSLHISFYLLSGHPCKIYTGKKKKKNYYEKESFHHLSLFVFTIRLFYGSLLCFWLCFLHSNILLPTQGCGKRSKIFSGVLLVFSLGESQQNYVFNKCEGRGIMTNKNCHKNQGTAAVFRNSLLFVINPRPKLFCI